MCFSAPLRLETTPGAIGPPAGSASAAWGPRSVSRAVISRTFCAPHVGRVGAVLLNSNLVGSFANSREFLYDV